MHTNPLASKKSVYIRIILCAGLVLGQSATAMAQARVIHEMVPSTGLSEKWRDFPNWPTPTENIERPALATPVMREEGPRFVVRQVRVKGNTLLSKEDLQEQTNFLYGSIGQLPDIDSFSLDSQEGVRIFSFADLQRFASELTDFYSSRGYVTTTVYVPPQKVDSGEVILQVMEGKVGQVNVEGERWFSEAVYRAELGVQPGDLFDVRELERRINDLNNSPDRSVRAYLNQGEGEGVSDIVLKAKENVPWHASYEVNRRGSNLTHHTRHLVHLTDNNFLGFADSMAMSVSMAQQGAFDAGEFTYIFPDFKNGLRYQLQASAARSQLQKEWRSLNIVSDSMTISPSVTKTFVERNDLTLEGTLAFDVKNVKTEIDKDLLSEDNTRAVRTGGLAIFRDNNGQTVTQSDVHVGIPDILGGSEEINEHASRLDTGGEFVYVTSEVIRMQRINEALLLVAQAGGQWSPDPLPAVEQYALGGMYSVRGYPESDFAGDSGFNGSLELRTPMPFMPTSWRVPGGKGKSWREALSLVGFLDGGRAFNYNRQQASSQKDKTLIGAGAGIRFYMHQDMNGQVDVGVPLADESSEKDNVQVHFLMRMGF